jgi:hypothetical protein
MKNRLSRLVWLARAGVESRIKKTNTNNQVRVTREKESKTSRNLRKNSSRAIASKWHPKQQAACH